MSGFMEGANDLKNVGPHTGPPLFFVCHSYPNLILGPILFLASEIWRSPVDMLQNFCTTISYHTRLATNRNQGELDDECHRNRWITMICFFP